MELYGYTGQLGEHTNGKLKADTVDTYTVAYTKSKVEIANTTATRAQIATIIMRYLTAE